MQLPNPLKDKPFDEVLKEANPDPTKEPIDKWGVRHTNGGDEIVDLTTGQSNTKYWKPEMVINPQDCNHVFHLIDVLKREIECEKCTFSTNFIVGINFIEKKDKLFIRLQNKKYPILVKRQ